MSDHYGITTALKAAMNIYFASARKTGRTSSLVSSVKTGDRIIFSDSREAKRVERLCLERGVEIEALVVDPNRPEALFHKGRSRGKVYFDHSWIEEFYEMVFASAARDIGKWCADMSAPDAPKELTDHRKRAETRWRM